MSLTKTDKKEIILMMGEAIEQLVLPHFDELRDELKKDVKDAKEDLQEDIQDVQLTVNRIETRQKAEVERVDDHEVRITKIGKAITA